MFWEHVGDMFGRFLGLFEDALEVWGGTKQPKFKTHDEPESLLKPTKNKLLGGRIVLELAECLPCTVTLKLYS